MKHEEHTPISHTQTLPSGLIVEIKEWTVGDIAAMGERGKGGNIDRMMARCVVVEDPHGVYSFKQGSIVSPEKLQTGDRTVILILQRIITHWRNTGPFFEFSFQCQDEDCQDANKKPIPWSVDLRRFLLTKEDLDAYELVDGETPEDYSDCPVYLKGGNDIVWVDRFGTMPITIGNDRTAFMQHLSPEGIEKWKDGNRFEFVDPYTERTLYWKLMTGLDETALQKFRKSPDKYRMNALGRRIVEVDGVQSINKSSWLNEWSAGAEDHLQDHINEIEPGMFREFDVCCPRCGLVQEISFPLDLTFFSPSLRKKKRGKTS